MRCDVRTYVRLPYNVQRAPSGPANRRLEECNSVAQRRGQEADDSLYTPLFNTKSVLLTSDMPLRGSRPGRVR